MKPAVIMMYRDDGEITKSSDNVRKNKIETGTNGIYNNYEAKDSYGFSDSGSKSRFFDIDVWGEKNGIIQIPKASQSERNARCENIEPKTEQNYNPTKGNYHPTVKPVHLMAWLIRLVTKPGDTVLDPFAGSGTTAVACIKQNRNFVGSEISPEYVEIANERIKNTKNENPD